jgi:MinD superfamily P-loop ATPase
MAPIAGISLQAAPTVGGVAPFSYQWSFSSMTTVPMTLGALTTITPTFATVTTNFTVGVTAPLTNQLLACTVRCKVTDSTGGTGNPVTNLVTYAYYNLFVTAPPDIN